MLIKITLYLLKGTRHMSFPSEAVQDIYGNVQMNHFECCISNTLAYQEILRTLLIRNLIFFCDCFLTFTFSSTLLKMLPMKFIVKSFIKQLTSYIINKLCIIRGIPQNETLREISPFHIV